MNGKMKAASRIKFRGNRYSNSGAKRGFSESKGKWTLCIRFTYY